MKTRTFDVDDLIKRCLEGEEKARKEFNNYYQQKVFSNEVILSLKERLQLEADKPDHTINHYAIFFLAKLYVYEGGAENIARAKALYERALELGNPLAMQNLACLLEDEGGAENIAKAKVLYERALKPGDYPDSMNDLAILLKNEGGAENIARAKALYERALEFGDDPEIMSNLAILLENEGGAENIARAKALYERALELGNPLAMQNLACLLEDEGGADNIARAKAIYERALELGDYPDIMNNLALLLKDEGGAENIARAKALYERALELGDDPDIMNNLALLLKDEGGPENIARAKALYERALEFGDDPDTTHNLAILLVGEGGIDNLIKAAQLYRQSFLIKPDDTTKEYLLNLLGKTTDLHVQYHAHMLNMTNEKIPDEVIKIFNTHPEEVIRFMLTDSLLTELQKQVVLDHIAQHYVSLASKAENDPAIMLALYNKIPEGARDYLETRMEQSQIIFSSIIYDKVAPEQLLSTLKNMMDLDKYVLQTMHDDLLKKIKFAELSEGESALLETITSILASPASRINKVLPKLEMNLPLSNHEKNLHLYVGHKRKLDHYAKPLRKYLLAVRKELDALAQQKNSPSDLWKKSLPEHLKLALITLKTPGRLPKSTNGIINLAATVHQYLLADGSKAGRDLAEKLPSFADIPRKRVGRSAAL